MLNHFTSWWSAEEWLFQEWLIHNGLLWKFSNHNLGLGGICVEDSIVRSKGIMVRAFDGTKTSAYGVIDHKILIGQCKFKVSFVVVDVAAVFSLLVGRPWTHTAGAIS